MDPSLNRFPARRAFVTGAGSGLGRALCRRLALRGWIIGVQDVNEEGARETLNMVEQLGGRGEFYVFDVSDGQAFLQAAQAFVVEQGGIDLVVNNAGVGVGGRIGDVPLADWAWIVGINLLGVAHGCHAFVPLMRQQSSGHVVNIASLAGLVSAPSMGPYNATKAGVVALTETLRAELDGSGVSCSVVCPGFFKTSIAASGRTTSPDADRMRQLVEKMMDRSKLSAEDVAELILEAVAEDRLYVLPHREARLMWLLKRASPRLFTRVMASGFRRGLDRRLLRQART